MKVFLKPVLAALLGFGALVGAQTSHALPTCASAGGMTLTGPDQPVTTGTQCSELSSLYNAPHFAWGSDPVQAIADFMEILAAQWGGVASDWVFLGEIDTNTDSQANDQKILDYKITNRSITSGASASQGAFSMSVQIDPDIDDPAIDNATEFTQKNLGKKLDIVGLIKPETRQLSDPTGSGTRDSAVLAYLNAAVVIGKEGPLAGTFDFGDGLGNDFYIPGGIGLYARVLPATGPGNGGGGVPEPAALALVFGAGVAAAIARRRRPA